VKKAVRIITIASVLLIIAGIIAVFIVNSRYEFLTDAPRVSHETLLTPNTSIRAAFQPPLAKPLVAKLLGDQAPSDWILDRVMPYEAAVMAAPDVIEKRFDVVLFLNARRLAPVILDYAKTFEIPRHAPFLEWDTEGFSRPRAGVLALTGTTDIDDETAQDVLANWGVVTIPARPVLEGGHLCEISIDNRDGSLYGVIMLMSAKSVIELPVSSDIIRDSLLPVATLYLAGDMEGDDELKVRLVCECQPGVEEGEVTAVSFTLGGLIGELTKLVQSRGSDLEGSKRTEGTTITGEYTIAPFSNLLVQ